MEPRVPGALSHLQSRPADVRLPRTVSRVESVPLNKMSRPTVFGAALLVACATISRAGPVQAQAIGMPFGPSLDLESACRVLPALAQGDCRSRLLESQLGDTGRASAGIDSQVPYYRPLPQQPIDARVRPTMGPDASEFTRRTVAPLPTPFTREDPDARARR